MRLFLIYSLWFPVLVFFLVGHSLFYFAPPSYSFFLLPLPSPFFFSTIINYYSYKTGVVQRKRLQTFANSGRAHPRIHALVFDPKDGILNRLPVRVFCVPCSVFRVLCLEEEKIKEKKKFYFGLSFLLLFLQCQFSLILHFAILFLLFFFFLTSFVSLPGTFS